MFRLLWKRTGDLIPKVLEFSAYDVAFDWYEAIEHSLLLDLRGWAVLFTGSVMAPEILHSFQFYLAPQEEAAA